MLNDAGQDILLQEIPGTAHAVSSTLKTLQTHLNELNISEECRENLMIVLGEVLNNIVEHAYANQGHGVIKLRAVNKRHGVYVCAADQGRPMQGGATPSGLLPEVSDDMDAIPEGGFGWFIIHSLAQDMTYERVAGENRLEFSIPN